jgi:hypothetical protein
MISKSLNAGLKMVLVNECAQLQRDISPVPLPSIGLESGLSYKELGRDIA